MLRRIATTLTMSVLLVSLAAVPALGWGNGPGDIPTQDGNGYGTHDWVLDNAIRMTRSADGGNASWVNVEVALRATDDPDYGVTATSGEMHGYKNTGVYQGGPQAVADEYFQLMTAYNKGDYTQASRHLGVMSHYYSDICQPYHTDARGTMSENNGRHHEYELTVTELTRTRSSSAGWLSADPRTDVYDIRSQAVQAALYARTKYTVLDAYLAAHNGRVTGDAHSTTGDVLNRATNDLADIIRAVPRGEGLAKSPTVMKQRMQKMTYYYPRKGTRKADMVRSEVRCYDAAGRPMRGVKVTFVWPLSITKKQVAFTDGDGMAYNWQAPDYGISLMKKRSVVSQTVQSNQIATASTWFMPTPVLASGTAGMKTNVSTHRPKQGTVLKAKARVRDTAGKPVVGLPVTFTWGFKSQTVVVKTFTNASGYAYSSRNIGKAPKGYRVYVKGRVYSGRHTRNSRASFVPK